MALIRKGIYRNGRKESDGIKSGEGNASYVVVQFDLPGGSTRSLTPTRALVTTRARLTGIRDDDLFVSNCTITASYVHWTVGRRNGRVVSWPLAFGSWNLMVCGRIWLPRRRRKKIFENQQLAMAIGD